MKRRPRRAILFFTVLAACAVPGLLLLVRDVFFPPKGRILDRVLRWTDLAREAGARFSVDPLLVLAVISVESRGDPRAVSPVGARGLMQLMPPTARETAEWIRMPVPSEEDLFTPETNVTLGTAYLKEQLESFANERLALAAYNAGPRRVRDWLDAEPGIPVEEALSRRVFPVTRAYIEDVLEYRDLLRERNRGR